MRVFIPQINWIGNLNKYLTAGLEGDKIEVGTNENYSKRNWFIRATRLYHIGRLNQWEYKNYLNKYNEVLLRDCLAFKPDVFLVFNECRVQTEVIKNIKIKTGARMVLVLGDDPWDSSRFRELPHSLRYFDIIFNAEPSWNVNLKNVAPRSKIFFTLGGFDKEFYHPIKADSLSTEDKKRFACDVSFTGTSYGEKAEGAYRSEILSYLTDFNLKIFGDNNWPYRFRFLPELSDKYKGSRLSYSDLRKLYTLSNVNLNLPNPQAIESFQSRIFEIAAVKGFQITDNRPLVREFFAEKEVVTFDNIDELRDKLQFYLTNEKDRKEITHNLYQKIIDKYTWKNWAATTLKMINNPEQFEEYILDYFK